MKQNQLPLTGICAPENAPKQRVGPVRRADGRQKADNTRRTAGWTWQGIFGLVLALLLCLVTPRPTLAQSEAPIRMRIVGGLADVSQYLRYEEPFWRDRISQATNGRIVAEIAPFDRSGIRGQEMLSLI